MFFNAKKEPGAWRREWGYYKEKRPKSDGLYREKREKKGGQLPQLFCLEPIYSFRRGRAEEEASNNRTYSNANTKDLRSSSQKTKGTWREGRRDFKRARLFIYHHSLPPETRCYHLTAVSHRMNRTVHREGHCPNVPCDPQQAKYSQRGFDCDKRKQWGHREDRVCLGKGSKGEATSHLSQSGADAEHLTWAPSCWEDESARGQWAEIPPQGWL